ncbi:phospho-N-acetylmuramoyl-pentapeptide-transferase [Candidatus Uhrbacteria bacterium]|nr:phospho-N-acetylmuramoyl-pentapeptide-transferase [Candidatus Uhrbacteria bacterium]
MGSEVLKISLLSTLAFLVAWAWEPLLIRLLQRYGIGKQIRDGRSAPVYSKLHQAKKGMLTMGGVLVWVTVLIIAVGVYYLSVFFPNPFFSNLNFLSRSQVFLPLGAMVFAAIVGMVDDFYNVKKLGPKGGGLSMRHRFLLYTLIASVCAWWFYVKLGWDFLHIPFMGDISIGLWYVPFFILVIVATAFSVNEIDGLDGLAGGTLLSAFGAYGAIAFIEGKYDLATFCGVIIGALLAFLWYNIYPAKFMMGDTGAMSLGVTLGIVAILTNSALLLPIIGLLFVIASLSVIIQTASKKLWGKKIFLSSPIHHHLEASGWTEPTIVMRFWVIAIITAVIGVIIVLVERGFY